MARRIRPVLAELESRLTPTDLPTSLVGYAIRNNALYPLDTAVPSDNPAAQSLDVITGDALVGLDVRPQTGQLYAVGINATANNGSLYLVDPQTGVLTHIGGAGTIAFVDGAAAAVDLPDPATSGYGIDFNPVTDRIRITTDTGLNFRVNPVTGAPVDGDQGGAAGSVTGINTDGIISGLPLGSTGVSGTAYTNSYGQALGSGVTTLYTLDATSNKLFIQNPANAGTETNGVTVTLNGAPLDFGSVNGFDIPPDVHAASSGAQAAGFGYAALTVGGVAGLYQIDLTTGVATSLGVIGLGATQLAGLTLANAHVNLAPTAVALSSASVQEFATNGTVVGAFSTVDPNVADTHTYSLIDNAGGRFGISGNNLVVTDKLLLDFEQAKSHTVTVRSTDSFGKFIDKVLTINVSDVNPETIVGDVRDNIFVGGALKDVFDGAGGNDRLTGGLGRDTLTGGAGSDTFDFNAIAESGKKASTRDVITDFKHKTDHIDLKDIDANSKKPGDQAFKFIGTADFHHVKGELHYVKIDNPGTKHDMTIVSGDTNGDGRADFQIELSHLVTLTKVDFIL